MKKGKILLFLAFLIILPAMPGCSSEKEVSQRRNFMMPHRDELPRNANKYRGSKPRKTYKPKKHKRSCIILINTEQSRLA